MAAVTRVKAVPAFGVGYEVIRPVFQGVALTEDVTAGDLVLLSADGWSKAPAGDLFAHGIMLKDGKAGSKRPEIGAVGEMDGYSGLTPGAYLYISGTVDGGLDTTKPSGGVAQVLALTATRISFDFGP